MTDQMIESPKAAAAAQPLPQPFTKRVRSAPATQEAEQHDDEDNDHHNYQNSSHDPSLALRGDSRRTVARIDCRIGLVDRNVLPSRCRLLFRCTALPVRVFRRWPPACRTSGCGQTCRRSRWSRLAMSSRDVDPDPLREPAFCQDAKRPPVAVVRARQTPLAHRFEDRSKFLHQQGPMARP